MIKVVFVLKNIVTVGLVIQRTNLVRLVVTGLLAVTELKVKAVWGERLILLFDKTTVSS